MEIVGIALIALAIVIIYGIIGLCAGKGPRKGSGEYWDELFYAKLEAYKKRKGIK